MFGLVRREMHAIQFALEQVDSWGRKQPEVARVQRVFQTILNAIERQIDFELISRKAGAQATEITHGKAQKSLRKGKIFLQQPIAVKSRARHRQQRFTILESRLNNRTRGTEMHHATGLS